MTLCVCACLSCLPLQSSSGGFAGAYGLEPERTADKHEQTTGRFVIIEHFLQQLEPLH